MGWTTRLAFTLCLAFVFGPASLQASPINSRQSTLPPLHSYQAPRVITGLPRPSLCLASPLTSYHFLSLGTVALDPHTRPNPPSRNRL